MILLSAYFVTGATGFVGGALTLELLTQTDQDVMLLVREKGGASGSPEARVDAALRKAASSYNIEPGFLDEHRHRVRAVVGDLTGEVSTSSFENDGISGFWHCAASLQFDDKDAVEIHSTNVDGTKKALALAESLGAEEFNYVSTAYVAGRRTGVVEEGPATDRESTHNHYERSKIDAEQFLLEADTTSRIRIWRPSVVVGHSSTFAATSFTGMYGFMKELVRFKMEVQSKLGAFLTMRPIQIMADPSMRLNIVPVDLVVRQAVALSRRGVDSDIIHLTNATPPVIGSAMALLFEELELAAPVFVAKKSVFTSLDQDFDKGMKFYGSYMSGDKEFQQTTALDHGSPIDFEFDDETLLSYFRWYLSKLRSVMESRGMKTVGLL